MTLSMLLGACAAHGPPPAASPRPFPSNGATAAVDEAAFDAQRATRVEELLRGRFAGVTVSRTGDGDYAVRIRGDRDPFGGEPLFVLDGMPIAGALRRGLAGISPHDVARIEVLKDAAATAPYGVQGRNGVVLITTRRR